MSNLVIRNDDARAEHEGEECENDQRNLPLKRKSREAAGGLDSGAHRFPFVLLIPASSSFVLLGAELTITVLERSPQIPTRHGAMRAPLGANLPNVFRRRPLSLSVRALDGVLNPQI